MSEPSTHESVNYALELSPKKMYRRKMAKKKTARISGNSLRIRRETLGFTQGDVARLSGIDQRDISRIELEQVKGGEIKQQYVTFLAKLEGLQPKSDSDMTHNAVWGGRATYDLRLFKPILVPGGCMSFAAEADSYVKRPHFLIAIDDAYAFIMKGNSMSPRYDDGDTLYVNPTLRPEVGKPCIFFDVDGVTGQVGILRAESPEYWQIQQYDNQEIIQLARAEWPKCLRIEGTHTP